MKRKWIVFVGGLIISGIMATAAFAADTGKGNTTAAGTDNCTMNMETMCKTMMDQHVKDGIITQEQADKMQEHMNAMKDMQGKMSGMMMDNKMGHKMCCGEMKHNNTKQSEQKK